jgi:hypothetical protein
MNPQMFGNLGMFNYGALGDSPALGMPPAAAMPPGGQDPFANNQLQQFLRYISGIVAMPQQDNPRMGAGSFLSGDDPAMIPGLGGLRG